MSDHLIQKILEKIKNEKIQPRPKWEFLLKTYAFWGSFFLSLFLGSLAVAIIIFRSRMTDWNLHSHSGDNFGIFIIKALPFLWIIALLSFIAIAYYNIRHTKTGYRYNFTILVVISVAVSVILGAGLDAFSLSEKIENNLSAKIPAYGDYSYGHMASLWSRPEEGLLAGEIIKVNSPVSFELADFKNKIWLITSDRRELCESSHFLEGKLIKLIGEQTGEHDFIAYEFRPWFAPLHKRGMRGGMGR
jgi:hypothetical protein